MFLILRLSAIAIVLTGLLIVLYHTDNPSYRYREFSCHFDSIYRQNGKIHIAGIGGSRILTAFGAQQLERILINKNQDAPVVYNISHNKRGLDLDFVILRDLLENHEVDNLVVMVDRQSVHLPQDEFFMVARIRDLFHYYMAQSFKPRLERISGVFRLLAKRLNRWGYAKEISENINRPAVTTNCHAGDMPLNLDRLLDGTEITDLKVMKPLVMDLDDEREQYTVYFLRLISQLGEQYKTNIFFVHMPYRNKPTFAHSFKGLFERKIGGHLIIIPVEIRQRLAEKAYRDNTHMYALGKEIYLEWLVRGIEEECRRSQTCY